MNRLDSFYVMLLSRGFLVLRQAVDAGNREWIEAEVEMLHNIPSLIGEKNLQRHRYYWTSERTHYIEWASSPGQEEARSRMQTFYLPVWRDMEPLVSEVLALQETGI